MRALRWLLVVPAGIATMIVVELGVELGTALRHGVYAATAFWEAADMGQWWVSGTLYVILWRGGAAALSTWAVFRVAPDHKVVAARVWTGLLAALTVFWSGSIVSALSISQVPLSFGHWYRFLLEVVALLGGALLAYLQMRSDSATSGSGKPQQQRISSWAAFCRSCGTTVEHGSRFCAECGSEVDA